MYYSITFVKILSNKDESNKPIQFPQEQMDLNTKSDTETICIDNKNVNNILFGKNMYLLGKQLIFFCDSVR